MFAFLSGTVAYKTVNFIALNVNGIGFQVFVPAREMIGVQAGDPLMLYTYTNIREDALELYGFRAQDELDMFVALISVSGVGPKSALSLLDVMTASGLAAAIVTGDEKAILKAQGIGKKTAQRILLELKDKVSSDSIFPTEDGEELLPTDDKDEAVVALTALGYTAQEAKAALRGAPKGLSVEELIKHALKQMY